MTIEELTDQSTTDEVREYAEQVVKEVEADRAGEQPERKGDAQIVSEHADNEKTPVAEKKSGDEKVAKAAKTAKADSGSWLDDNTKAEAAAFGLEESELADFTSREEFDRALRLFDKSALAAGRKALAEQSEAETGRNEKGQFVPKKEETPAAPDKGGFQITLDKDIYDEEIVGQFTALRDHYEARLQALESRLLEQDARTEEQHFDSLVDSLDHSDLFGKTGKEDDKQLQRRHDLMIQAKALMIGLAQLGRPTELDESLVNRAARMLYAEDFSKKEIKSRTRKISAQSNKRLGGGAVRPQDPAEDPREEAERLYKELVGS